jgi:hypothetical protein
MLYPCNADSGVSEAGYHPFMLAEYAPSLVSLQSFTPLLSNGRSWREIVDVNEWSTLLDA